MSSENEKPAVSFAGIVYGETVYWLTILATVLALVGMVVSFISSSNYMEPNYTISEAWQATKREQIWCGGVQQVPNGHWYLSKLKTGDGLMTAGIALGVFCVIPAMLFCAFFLVREKKQLFSVMAFVGALVTIVAMSGALNFLITKDGGVDCSKVQQTTKKIS